MKKKGWFSVLQNLSWLTQLGLSLAAPPVLCLLGANGGGIEQPGLYRRCRGQIGEIGRAHV